MKVWVLCSEDHEGTHALYGVFSNPQKAHDTLVRLIREQGHKVFDASGFGTFDPAPDLGEGESDVVTCEQSYDGDDPKMDFVATEWEVRYRVVDSLAD